MLVVSAVFGATVIKKYFTLSCADGDVDVAFSMESDEMKALVQETERAWQAIGDVMYGPTKKRKIFFEIYTTYLCDEGY
ncbi:N-acetylneuraminate synthase family protein [Peribacillus asahii]|uniref:N-acetylneuraminate synthase family protein n=1 Tax=Peribacillus asahii TaxID=228899 RepID=UPI002079BC51|nr:N-acetylneuraminate synthase family protein [Peribacillus asahii]USK69963.1 N-acetylneuraminate synthase family protein [Peribacillus asahii]